MTDPPRLIDDPRWEPGSEARHDRGDGNCFWCRNPLTEADKGPNGTKQICDSCLKLLKAKQAEIHRQAEILLHDL